MGRALKEFDEEIKDTDPINTDINFFLRTSFGRKRYKYRIDIAENTDVILTVVIFINFPWMGRKLKSFDFKMFEERFVPFGFVCKYEIENLDSEELKNILAKIK